MTMDVSTLGLICGAVYAAGMFSGAALEKYILSPRRKRLNKDN